MTEETADSQVESSSLTEDLELETRLDSSNPTQFELIQRMGALEEALLARDPLMKTHLAAIHKQLIQHEELVHLLSDKEIGEIVKAQQHHTGTVLAQESTSKSGKAKATARVAKLGLTDL